MEQLENLLEEYFDWFKRRYSIKELKTASEITTPFLNHLNDRICLYVEFLDDGIIRLSDDGVTLDELELFGIDLNVPTRKKILSTIIKNHGLLLDSGIIYSDSATPSEFPQNKQNLIQGILSVYDIILTSKDNTKGIFKEEVQDYFFENEFGGLNDPILRGNSGVNYNIDYSLGATKQRPLTLIRILNDPNMVQVAAQKYISDDLKKGLSTPKNSVNYIIIGNDDKKRIPQKSKIISKDMGIDLIPWSDKNSLLSLK